MLQIRELRKKRGLSQHKLAIATGLHQSMISKYERGELQLTVDRLRIIAQALDVPPATLLDSKNQEQAA
jgi:transcriptional regulator with XRE-family HTH domain